MMSNGKGTSSLPSMWRVCVASMCTSMMMVWKYWDMMSWLGSATSSVMSITMLWSNWDIMSWLGSTRISSSISFSSDMEQPCRLRSLVMFKQFTSHTDCAYQENRLHTRTHTYRYTFNDTHTKQHNAISKRTRRGLPYANEQIKLYNMLTMFATFKAENRRITKNLDRIRSIKSCCVSIVPWVPATFK